MRCLDYEPADPAQQPSRIRSKYVQTTATSGLQEAHHSQLPASCDVADILTPRACEAFLKGDLPGTSSARTASGGRLSTLLVLRFARLDGSGDFWRRHPTRLAAFIWAAQSIHHAHPIPTSPCKHFSGLLHAVLGEDNFRRFLSKRGFDHCSTAPNLQFSIATGQHESFFRLTH